MGKRIWIGFVTVFVTTQIIEVIVHFILLNSAYSQHLHIWRPIVEVRLWMLPVTGMFFSFFFVLIFSKGYEGKGLVEGVRYGVYVALLTVLPHAYSSYAMMQIPYLITLQWFLYETSEYIIAGVLLAAAFQLTPNASPGS